MFSFIKEKWNGWASGQESRVEASADALPPPSYPWSHRLPWQSFDHASMRRGYKVYTQVCATCHGINLIAYRNLVGNVLTVTEAKEAAAAVQIPDGPNDEGEMFERPGKLSDRIPSPYPNEKAARYANNGAYPPDLSLMVKARPGGCDYLFALLTGYQDAPAGVEVKSGLNYNPYFPQGQIAMPPPLSHGLVDYEDGTPNSVSQMAKDVTTFLNWTAEPEHDERKMIGIKAFFFTLAAIIPTWYLKRLKWSVLKTRQIKFDESVIADAAKKNPDIARSHIRDKSNGNNA